MLYATGAGQGLTSLVDGAFGLMTHMQVYIAQDKEQNVPIYQMLYDKKLTNGAGDVMRSFIKATPVVGVAEQFVVSPFANAYMGETQSKEKKMNELLGITPDPMQEKPHKSFKSYENEIANKMLGTDAELSPMVKEMGKSQQSDARKIKKSKEQMKMMQELIGN